MSGSDAHLALLHTYARSPESLLQHHRGLSHALETHTSKIPPHSFLDAFRTLLQVGHCVSCAPPSESALNGNASCNLSGVLDPCLMPSQVALDLTCSTVHAQKSCTVGGTASMLLYDSGSCLSLLQTSLSNGGSTSCLEDDSGCSFVIPSTLHGLPFTLDSFNGPASTRGFPSCQEASGHRLYWQYSTLPFHVAIPCVNTPCCLDCAR
eukprot:scaffold751_cov395-Prasinococcus_capsulatus_cf.AAC.39